MNNCKFVKSIFAELSIIIEGIEYNIDDYVLVRFSNEKELQKIKIEYSEEGEAGFLLNDNFELFSEYLKLEGEF